MSPAACLTLVAAAACAVPPEPAPAPGAFEDVRRVMATLDDIAGEHSHALARGELVDATRMRVMLHQLHSATVFAEKFPADEQAALRAVEARVAARAEAGEVVTAARELRERLLVRHRLVLGPGGPPPRARAEDMWRMLCAGCHGRTGAGDGPQGLFLDPEPKDFQDPDLLATLAPSRAFSWISDGVPETAMPQWGLFTAPERWALAFMVFAFRHDQDEVERGRLLVAGLDLPRSPRALADRTDNELLAELGARGLHGRDATDGLAYLRGDAAFALPPGPLAQVRALLAEALVAFREQRRDAAVAFVAAARAEVAAAVDGIRVADPVTAARLEHGMLRIQHEAAHGGLDDLLEREIVRTDVLVDRGEAALRAPSLLGGVWLALASGFAAALALGLLAAGPPRRRARAAIAAGLGAAAIAGAAVPPGSAAAGWCALVPVALLLMAGAGPARWRGELWLAAATALVILPVAGHGRALIGVLGAGGWSPWLAGAFALGAIAVLGRALGRRLPRLRPWAATVALMIAAAAGAGRGAWSIVTAAPVPPPPLAVWRVDAVGAFPATAALLAAAVAAAGVAAVTLARARGAGRVPPPR